MPLQENYLSGDVIYYECDERFKLRNISSNLQTCQNGNWSPEKAIFCDG